jgi:hypothetical protein
MSAAYKDVNDRKWCMHAGCATSYAKSVSTKTLKAHTATHHNQASLSATVASTNNKLLNEKLASILARLKLPFMIVERPEFRTELFDLIRSTTRPAPYRQAIGARPFLLLEECSECRRT